MNFELPVNVVAMWDGDVSLGEGLWDETGLGIDETIVAGWALCNGQNGTPDLRSKFVIGHDPSDIDYNEISKTGGAATVTLSVAQMPPHEHSFTVGYSSAQGTIRDLYSNDATSGGQTLRTVTTSAAGGGQAHENRPPYFVLAYIMKIA